MVVAVVVGTVIVTGRVVVVGGQRAVVHGVPETGGSVVGTVMQGTAQENVKLPGFRCIGNDRERNVHVSDDVDFVRVLNVVDDELARIEPGLAVVCAGSGSHSDCPENQAESQACGHAPLETGEEGNHDRVLRIWVRR